MISCRIAGSNLLSSSPKTYDHRYFILAASFRLLPLSFIRLSTILHPALPIISPPSAQNHRSLAPGLFLLLLPRPSLFYCDWCLSTAFFTDYPPPTPHLLPVNLYSSFLRQLQTFRPPTFNFSGSTQRPVSRFSLLFLFIPALTTFLRYFPSTLLFTFSSDVPSPTTTWPLHYPTLYFFHHPYFLTTLVHLLFRLLFPPLPPTTFAVPFFQCLFYAALPS